MVTDKEKLARAYAFIAEVERVLTDEPEFAATRIAKLFEEQGPALTEDRSTFG